MAKSMKRRSILVLLGGIATAGCTSNSSDGLLGTQENSINSPEGEDSDDSSNAAGTPVSPPDAAEKGEFELADVKAEPLESYVGISAIVYNNGPETGTVTVEFTAYDNDGNQLHQGTDTVIVESHKQVPISMYWEKNPANPPFQGWDARIVSVN